jgi:hypothetical protein
MKHFVFGIFLLVFSVSVFGQEGSLENLRKDFKQYPNTKSILEISAVRYLAVQASYDYASKKWYRFNPDENERNALSLEAETNYHYTKCKTVKIECEGLETRLKIYPYLKKNLKIIEIPKVNGAEGTFTLADGRVYSAKTGQLTKQIAKKEVKSQPEINKVPAFVDKVSVNTERDSDDESDLKCNWSSSFPRKIIKGPGCRSEGDKICIGYVTCTAGKYKIDRLATCSESLCGNETAAACAKQQGYGSKDAVASSSSYEKTSTKSPVNSNK